MNSLTHLREVVDVVIGVDTHVHTHSAAMVDAATGGVLDEITVEATAEGYAELVEFANNHAMLRAWAIEGTGGHGAGLSRHLLESSEIVIESDRPKRAARRNGAKSDPLDAIRAAREAMARPQLGTPRTGGERQALSVLLAARRSAINASAEAQQQVFSLATSTASSKPAPLRLDEPWERRGRGHQAVRRCAIATRCCASGKSASTSRRRCRSCARLPAARRSSTSVGALRHPAARLEDHQHILAGEHLQLAHHRAAGLRRSESDQPSA